MYHLNELKFIYFIRTIMFLPACSIPFCSISFCTIEHIFCFVFSFLVSSRLIRLQIHTLRCFDLLSCQNDDQQEKCFHCQDVQQSECRSNQSAETNQSLINTSEYSTRASAYSQFPTNKNRSLTIMTLYIVHGVSQIYPPKLRSSLFN